MMHQTNDAYKWIFALCSYPLVSSWAGAQECLYRHLGAYLTREIINLIDTVTERTILSSHPNFQLWMKGKCVFILIIFHLGL